LESGRGVDVGHLAARPADEVVVMSGEVLRQCEAAVVVGSAHPPGHPDVDEHGDVAVGAALRKPGVVLEDFGTGERSSGASHRLDERPAQRRVALLTAGEPQGNLVVDGRLGAHRIMTIRCHACYRSENHYYYGSCPTEEEVVAPCSCDRRPG